MLKHILVPLDGSLLAKTALDFAIQIADSSCKITLVTAVQEPEYPTYPASPISITRSITNAGDSGRQRETLFRGNSGSAAAARLSRQHER